MNKEVIDSGEIRMDDILAHQSEQFHALRETMVASLEKERAYGCRLAGLRQTAEALTETTRRFLAALGNDPPDQISRLASIIPCLENVYLDWKAIETGFKETLKLAYREVIPESNLRIDSVLASLEGSVGEPVCETYARLQTAWRRHLESHPWDSHVSDIGGHLDGELFRTALTALNRGDEFDIEDATENLTGPFRHLLTNHLKTCGPDETVHGQMASNLWKRPEIVVANDYWQRKHRTKIIDVLLSDMHSPPAVGFAKVREFFHASTGDNKKIVSFLKELAHDDREKFLRCLLLHPDQGIRRYAVTNVSGNGFWKSLTPATVPCSTILSLLERVVGSSQFDENFRKIFFDSVYKRLLYLTSRSEVLYARGIVRILAQLDFFIEDLYFEKLMHVLNYIESKEHHYKLAGSLLEDHIARLKDLKQKAGSLDSPPPEFGAVPLVVLRRLAKDGHFWFELALHPIFKIAKETIPYINSRERAARVVSQRNANQDVIRAIGKNKPLFASRTARLALLSNPRTPPAVSLEYLPELERTEVEALLRKSTIHPEIRQRLRLRLDPSTP